MKRRESGFWDVVLAIAVVMLLLTTVVLIGVVIYREWRLVGAVLASGMAVRFLIGIDSHTPKAVRNCCS